MAEIIKRIKNFIVGDEASEFPPEIQAEIKRQAAPIRALRKEIQNLNARMNQFENHESPEYRELYQKLLNKMAELAKYDTKEM